MCVSVCGDSPRVCFFGPRSATARVKRTADEGCDRAFKLPRAVVPSDPLLDGSLQGQLHACSPERLTSPEVGERSTITCSLVRLLPCVLLTKEVAPWTVWIPEQHVCVPSRCHHTAVAPFERRCLYGEFMVLGLDSVQFGYNAESLLM